MTEIQIIKQPTSSEPACILGEIRPVYMGYYVYETDIAELNIAWPGWRFIHAEIIPDIVCEVITHEFLHGAINWGTDGHTDDEWYNTEHDCINIIGIILRWKSTSWGNTMNHIRRHSKNMDEYYRFIAKMLTSKFG